MSHYYDIHNLTLKVVSNHRQLLRFFDELLGCFQSSAFSGKPALVLDLFAIPSQWMPSVQIPESWTIYDCTSHISCYRSGQALLYQYNNQGIFFTDVAQGYGRGYIRPPYSAQESLDIYQNIWLLAVFHMMRARGIFPLHASAAMFKDKGVLLAGDSGQGKTTLLLHVLKEGFRYMADDTLLLRHDGDCPTMLSFPTPVRITAETAGFFPELESFIAERVPDSRGKYCLDTRCFSALPPAHSALPGIVVFPEITPGHKSKLIPISRMAAAVRCVPRNTPVNAIGVSRNNFEVLCRLFNNVQCYQARLGQNMQSVSRQIVDLIRTM